MGKKINIELAANFDKGRRRNDPPETAPRVLVVDDDAAHRDSLCELITTTDIKAAGASDGQQALELLEAEDFDMVLLDLNMPKLDGHEVLKRIRESSRSPGVIVISGEPSWDSAQNTLRGGADDFIRKPYAPDEVLTAIQNLLRKRKLVFENDRFQKQLSRSEHLHRFIVNNSPDFIFILNHEGRFTFQNDTLSSLLGYHNNILLNHHYSELFIDKAGQIALLLEDPASVVNTPNTMELQAKHRDEGLEPLVMELTLMATKSETGDGDLLHGVARNVTERKKAQDMISYQAYHDMLTGLPNRTLFKDRLGVAIKHAQRSNERVAIMFVDLDRFKTVNDSLGHSYGDRLLQEVALRIKDSVREGDTIARLGGDEFTLILPNIHQAEDAESIASKMVESLRSFFQIGDHEIFIRASVGIALYPDHGSDIESLLKHADMAMYDIKGNGRDGFGFFTSKMEEKYAQRLSVENGMRRALKAMQFEVHYQPQVHMDTGKFCGMEALIRWRHPEKGYIPPVDFISHAEDSGLIMPIGLWVMERVMSDLCDWDQMGIRIDKASLNVSAMQLEQPNFVQQVGDLLKKYQLAGDRLVFEITENVLLGDMELMIQRLKQLNVLGIRVSIDDFGTGYSSLSYLKSLPISAIKIDRSFIMDIDSNTKKDSIITAIITMARSLDLELVAEGIEEEEQAEYLQSVGCSIAQGFLYSRPLSREDFTTYLLAAFEEDDPLQSAG